MTSIDSLTIEATDPTAAKHFYSDVLGLDAYVRVDASDEPTTGFRWFTLSLVVAAPASVDALVDAALEAGATSLKPAEKSFWGYGGAIQAPDGTAITVATSAKKNTDPPSRELEGFVLQLGVTEVKETKRFYRDQGLAVKRSFGSKYVEFEPSAAGITLSLYGRRALAKHVGLPAEGTGSHRLVVEGASEPFTDPDGFVWKPSAR